MEPREGFWELSEESAALSSGASAIVPCLCKISNYQLLPHSYLKQN
jgi:hypothetical protein